MLKIEVYDIGGMHCAACSSAVERVTHKLSGVEKSEVNLPLNRLTICYDETICKSEDIVRKIEKAGFTASLHSENDRTLINEPNTHKTLKQEKIELYASVIFAGVLLFISMAQMLFPDMPMPEIFSMHTHGVNFALLQILLCVPVLFLGKSFFINGFTSLFHGNPNMDTLVAISASSSFLYSLVMTFIITDNAHAVHNLYFESAAVVVALVSVGKFMEFSNKEKTKDAITKLMQLAPDTAILIDDNGQWEVPTSTINIGNTILIKPGARVPLDGIVIDGAGDVNEAMLTGESMPIPKTVGCEVIGGSVSIGGVLYVKVTRIGNETTLSKIIRFVEDAQGKKAPISRVADKVAGIFVPIVIIIAFVAAIIWLICGYEFSFALNIFTCVLVIACPCAMGLATPTAIIVGTGLGAQHGILIRSGEALEITHKVSVAVFDKTGTLTTGKPKVTDVVSDNKTELLTVAFSLEVLSDHPLSKSICAYSANYVLTPKSIANFENIVGRGLLGTDSEGNQLIVGNPALMAEKRINIEAYNDRIKFFSDDGKTVVVIAQANKVLGLIAIADTIKTDAAEAICALKKLQIRTVLLTGDNKSVANYIGQVAGVDEIIADVLPTDKANVVKHYQENGAKVMMVGDGINDAPALMQADVGCAIGSGSDIAIDSADIVLMKPELNDVYRAIRLSRLTICNIKQNLFWAFFYNIIGIPIAAGVLYPFFGLLLSPMIGGLAMSLSSLFVVANALRLKKANL